MGMPILSIIVPVYNVEKYIEECLNSLINQNFKDLEIIIVDDGSTDNSLKYAKKIAITDNRIKVIHQENKGLPEARNSGLKIAKGKYIGFIDSDDTIQPEMYSELIYNLESNNSDICICGTYRYDRRDKYICDNYKNETIEKNEKNLSEFYKFAIASSCNKVYKKSIIDKYNLKFLDKKIVDQEDFYFLIRYLTHINKITTIDGIYYNYRIRKSSITNSIPPRDLASKNLTMINLFKEYISKNKIELNIDDVISYLFYKMLKDAINCTSPISYSKIYTTLKLFKEDNNFDIFINKYKNINLDGQSKIRIVYDKVNILLLRREKLRLFALLEFARIKKLSSKKKNNIQYYV